MRLAIVFGGTYDMYQRAGTLDELSRAFTKEAEHRFRSGFHELTVFFAYGSAHDVASEQRRERKSEAGETFAAPGEEVAQEIKRHSPDLVLFFGIAGGVNARINTIHHPSRFSLCAFTGAVKPEDIRCGHTLSIHNRLGSRLREFFGGTRQLTTNVAWSTWIAAPEGGAKGFERIWPRIEHDLKERGHRLSGKAAAQKWCELRFEEAYLPVLRSVSDLVDMESYAFVKAFPDRIGVLLQVSDELGTDYREERVDWRLFNTSVIDAIRRSLP